MSKSAIGQLREQVRAAVVTAGDPGYDEARTVHNGMFDKHPKVIVRAEQVADVIAAVRFAPDAGLDLSGKGGGHSPAGLRTNDDRGLLPPAPVPHVAVCPPARTPPVRGRR